MADFTLEITDMRDESSLDRSGSVSVQKRVTFYLGKFGPFVEKFPTENFSDITVRARADALRATLENLHR